MRTPKYTPEIRFIGFTDDWEQRKLGEVADIRRGLTYSPNDIRDNGVKVLRSSNIYDDIFCENEDDVFVDPDTINIPFAQNGDILITAANGSTRLVGKHAIIKLTQSDKVVHGGFMLLARTRNPYFINASMSSFWYSNFISTYVAGGNGAIGNLSKSDLDNQLIYIPNETEQTAIGNFFKQLDETIALHQREAEKYKNLKISYLERMFPKENEQFPELRFPEFTDAWEQRKLGEISISFSGGTPNVTNNLYYGGKIPFIRSGEINSEKTELFITELGLENSSAKLVKKGDILYALYGATSGEVGRSKIGGAINQAILAIITNPNNDPEFISQWLRRHKSIIIQTYLQGGQGNLSGEIVKNLDITMPISIEEQTAIGNFFKQLDETIALHQRKAEKYKQIKQAYLEKMFV